MPIFDFTNLTDIEDFQPINDKEGFIITKDGEFYKYDGDNAELISTPKEFSVTGFHFRDAENGIIYGQAGKPEKEVQKGSIIEGGSLLTLAIMTILLLGWMTKSKVNAIRSVLILFALSLAIIACSSKWQANKSVDPDRPFITRILSPIHYHNASHTYVSNKGLTTFVAITSDGGQNWNVYKANTNFYPTVATSVGDSYLVGNFANRNTSPEIPYHGDGDIMVFGTSGTFTSVLGTNETNDNHLTIDIQRGINGIYHDKKNKKLLIYGSETEPVFPKDEVSTSPGNICIISDDFKSDYRIIDVPNKVNVMSLSINNHGDIWVTIDDKAPVIRDGHVEFEKVPYSKLMTLKKGAFDWEEIKVSNENFNASQIEFINQSSKGYLLVSEGGKVFKTEDGGINWVITKYKDIRKLHSKDNNVWALSGSNQIISVI